MQSRIVNEEKPGLVLSVRGDIVKGI